MGHSPKTMQTQRYTQWGEIHIKNIGGIEQATAKLATGVTVLSGKNATNRTSFLRALSAVLGSNDVTLKGDSDKGSVELTVDDETYAREITRQNGTLRFSGKPYLDEDKAAYADLFAFLFERNKARSAIRQGGNLHDIVMKPVDTEAIENQITQLKSQRDEKQQRKEEIESKLDKLPKLKTRESELQDKISELEDEIEAKEAEIEEAEGSLEEPTEQTDEVEEKLGTLRSKQSTLKETEANIETTQDAIESLKEELEAAEEAVADISVDEERLSALDSEISDLYDDINRKESMMNELQNIMQFNREMMEEERVDDEIFASLREGTHSSETDGDVTDKLLEDQDDIICWTCGNKTKKVDIQETLERLKSVHEDLFGERQMLSEQVEELEAEKEEIQEQKQQREKLRDKIDRTTQKVERRKQNLDQLEDRRESLTSEIASLEDEVQRLQEEQDNQLVELRQELSKLEYELEQVTDDFEETHDQIDSIKSLDEELEQVEQNIDDINTELEELRKRIEEIEQRTIDEFNTHMDEMLELLAYQNIDRIWLERKQVTKKKGRRKVQETAFDLHVIRSMDDGSVYEDTVEHLSESEREVTGLVFALAGYLAHDLHETVPCMILDSLEAIDSTRIAQLLDHFEEFVPNITVALLEEDAAALPDEYARVETF